MTDNKLFHDPRCKYIIKEELLSFIYKPVREHYVNRLKKIIARNSDIHKTNNGCFWYRGEIYKAEENIVMPRKADQLHESLRPEMDQYISDLDHLQNYELPHVQNFLNQILNATSSFQDYYAIFPESMHQPLKNLVNTDPCHSHHLDSQQIHNLYKQNLHPIELLKQRMVRNLLL